MKNFWKIIATVLTLVMTFVLCFTFAGCDSKKCERKGCSYPKVENGNYCSHHTCALEGCLDLSGNSTYCLMHGCHSWKCDNLTIPYFTSPDGLHTLYSRYCIEHTCKMDRCYNCKDTFSDYCEQHK